MCMQMTVINRVGRGATVIVFLAICWLSVMPSEIAAVDGFNDKAKHVFAFLVLALCISLFWRASRPFVAATLIVYGVAIELVQLFVPGRSASVWDVLADVIGIACGLLLATRRLG